MSKMKLPTLPRRYIHERREDQHRLVVLRNGIPFASRWYENREVGLYEGVYFHVGGAGETVPPLFRVAAVTHEVL